jgi:hypothetical protein
MIYNCRTIAINMRKCARDHQSANIGGGLFGPPELGAAANKIDAACDLLEALEYWFDSKATPQEIATKARIAIAKARGE